MASEVRKRESEMSTSRSRAIVTIGLFGMAVSGCAQPPATEVQAADDALASAIASGAEEYASASLASAQDLRAELDAEMAIQAEKFALTRSYDRATELADQARGAAEVAASETVRVKEEVRVETVGLMSEVKVALADVQEMLRTAPRGKGSAMDLVALQADLDSVSKTLSEGEVALNEGRYMEAKAKVMAGRSGTEGVRAAIESAVRTRTGR
jgi:hypothetical protein